MTSPDPAAPRHLEPSAPLRIALLGGRRTAPARAPMDAAMGEIESRLVRHGHEVTGHGSTGSLRRPGLRTPDVAFIFSPTAAPILPLLRRRGTAVALVVDGPGPQEVRRSRRAFEPSRAQSADVLITRTRHERDRWAAAGELPVVTIPEGSDIAGFTPSELVIDLGLEPGGFHLVVAASKRDERLPMIVEGYHRSTALLPLVVVVPEYSASRSVGPILALAERDERIRVLVDVREPLLEQLSAHALAFLHSDSSTASTRSLLRAMGSATAVVCWDSPRTRELSGTAGSYFRTSADLTRAVEEVERYPARFRDIGELMQERVFARHSWDGVAEAYEALACRLAQGRLAKPSGALPDLASDRSLSPLADARGHRA